MDSIQGSCPSPCSSLRLLLHTLSGPMVESQFLPKAVQIVCGDKLFEGLWRQCELQRHLLHQTPFTPNAFYTKQVLHQPRYTQNTQDTFYTRYLLHQPPFILHQTLFSPDNFYTKCLLHQTPFTPKHVTPNSFYT